MSTLNPAQTEELLATELSYRKAWLELFQRQNAALERIAQALEDIQANVSEVAAK